MATKPKSAHVGARLRRECFMTVGATASFRALIDSVFKPEFVDTISDLGFTHLTIQCGPDLAYVNSKIRDGETAGNNWKGIKLKTFDFNKLGLGAEMKDCKGVEGKSREGVVVCHAGAGTVLDAMRLDVPIIVVPNPSLLDNHQTELAEELERQGYATYGHLNTLPAVLRASDEKSKAKKVWPPQDSRADPTGNGITGVLDEEVDYEMRTRERLD